MQHRPGGRRLAAHRCEQLSDLFDLLVYLACHLRALLSLMKVIDLADMLGGVHQLKADALAVTASREAPALNDRHLALHVGMLAVVVIR